MENDPTARALRLLGLLQARAEWPAAELAERLGVSLRTVRRDAYRLRDLGYRIDARPGPGSAYRLLAGSSIPPLLFDADEITALVSGLRVIETRLSDDAAARALAKLERVLPAGLRRRADAMHLATEVLDGAEAANATDVGAVADAIADDGRVSFSYRDQGGRASTRTVDPYRHVLRGGHWYLIGYDTDRKDWRTFRFDRVREVTRVAGSYRRPPFPAESIERWLLTDFGRLS